MPSIKPETNETMNYKTRYSGTVHIRRGRAYLSETSGVIPCHPAMRVLDVV